MKNLYLSFLLILISNFSFSQLINRDSIYIVTNYTKIEKQIAMRDGVKLFTAIYIPNDKSVKHPMLILRTPYSCEPYGENKFTNRWWTRGDSVYFYRNYIIVMQDVRGRFMSEGTYEDVRPFNAEKKTNKETDESTDAYDTIDWLIKNIAESNGKVGVYGISYPGFYATMASLSNHPALKAVSPQAPVTDWFMGDDFHHNGVFALLDAFTFYRTFGVPRPVPVSEWPNVPSIKSNDNYSYFMKQGTFAEIKKKHFGDTMKFWNDMVSHPDYDDWWKARDARSGCKNIKPAVMVTGGLFDAENCFGAWNLYKAIEKQSPETNCKLVKGPWFHGGWAKSKGTNLGHVAFGSGTSDYYWRNCELPFFDYYLKGIGSADKISEATIFITGENKWYDFKQWPPAQTVEFKLYLHEKGVLSFKKPEGADKATSYISDPFKPVPYADDVHFKRTLEYMTDDQRFASRRPDVIVFETRPLIEDVTLTGALYADLFVSLSTSDADFVVKVIDVFPDDYVNPDPVLTGNYPMGGYQMLVRGEIMRGRYRNSFSNPEPFTPNEITRVKFALPDVAHTFLKGHRIMVQIQSSWYPLFDRNPQQYINPYTCETKDLVKSTINIFHDEAHPSNIILNVLKK